MNCNSNVVVPTLAQDECKGCQTKDECVNVTLDLTSIGIVTDVNLKEVIRVLVEKIVDLENQINAQ